MNVDDVDWRSESDTPRPTKVSVVDDRITADSALRRVRRGEFLLYRGDFHNARQLLAAMGRRLGRAGNRPSSALEAFRAERRQRQQEHQTLARVLVLLDPNYRTELKRAPPLADACVAAWGASTRSTLVPLKALLGVLSAFEWQKKGIRVPGLQGLLHPRYGVFVPTRSEYVEVLLQAPSPEGKTVFDVGTGTGVLSFVLLQRGAAHAVGTDIDERAVECARHNAEQLQLSPRYESRLTPFFPEGRADIVVCNPPWIPEPPKNRVDRAVFDEDNAVLDGFLSDLATHLTPQGEGWLILSNLAELLGLRAPGFLEERLAAHSLQVKWTRTAHSVRAPTHRDRPFQPIVITHSDDVITCSNAS